MARARARRRRFFATQEPIYTTLVPSAAYSNATALPQERSSHHVQQHVQARHHSDQAVSPRAGMWFGLQTSATPSALLWHLQHRWWRHLSDEHALERRLSRTPRRRGKRRGLCVSAFDLYTNPLILPGITETPTPTPTTTPALTPTPTLTPSPTPTATPTRTATPAPTPRPTPRQGHEPRRILDRKGKAKEVLTWELASEKPASPLPQGIDCALRSQSARRRDLA